MSWIEEVPPAEPWARANIVRCMTRLAGGLGVDIEPAKGAAAARRIEQRDRPERRFLRPMRGAREAPAG